MAHWENDKGEVIIKIAVVGQPGAGKLQIINQLAAAHGQSPVRTAVLSGAECARTEFIWPEPLPDGPFVRVRVFTISGTPMHQAAEQCLLADADAIVYVVNCEPSTITASRECLLSMTKNAVHAGVDWGDTVVVMQYNRADLYPGFKPSDLDGWLGITNGGVPRHITSTQGDDLGVAANDAASKVIAKLEKQLVGAN
ncbi:hypothetical protein NT6N_12960 [Oceaniferula spumae]|uniref:Uncharacterized protein n=1 Tax=Oceaniferula spumae TaxID=2979115 RepID=A0AAT9FJX8_9BACT